MVFSSLLFTYFFLPAVLILYYIVPEKLRNYVLLVFSLGFYAYGEPQFVFVMCAAVLFDYAAALLIARAEKKSAAAKALFFVTMACNIGLLFVYKYLGFTFATVNKLFHTGLHSEIALPIGISFFTFQAMSYVIDVYRGDVPVQKNPFHVALYVSFFPQLIAGPIVRYHTIEQQIVRRVVSFEKMAIGIKRFMAGFCKKVILANNFAVVSGEVFSVTDVFGEISVSLLWIGAIAYTLQIYFDFSGYSDMAIGLGKMFGFTFEENFRLPYACANVTDFWRRWHISLGSWFRDYVYVPLGGSRVSVPRHVRNLFIVWALTGLWHGANWTFIAWGLWYFVLLVIEKFLVKPEKHGALVKVCWRAGTLLCVMLGWVMFNSGAFSCGLNYCLGLFGGYTVRNTEITGVLHETAYYIRECGVLFIAGVIIASPLPGKIGALIDKNRATAAVRSVAEPVVLGGMFLWAVSFLILGAHNPFIYFNF